MREVIRRNGVDNGIIYLQITRGVAPRDHAFPKAAQPVARRDLAPAAGRRTRRLGEDGIAVITIPDIRWQRCDIKSIALVANVLGKQQAREAGAYEAWQVDRDGSVTEGTSTNAWIVTGDDVVVTRAADSAILNGVTRLALIDDHPARRVRARRAALHRGRGQRRRARPSSPAPPPTCCRWCRIDGDAGRRTATRARSAETLRAAYLAHAAERA